MPLEAGQRLGAFEIVAPLGQGGMGEVYRATDERLGRDVAIKVLPAEVAVDAERLARFEREAQLLASLSHTGIASIHGLEEANGEPFLVLELVEGEDLSQRLKLGPIPVDEAIDIAGQIAAALEEAHEHGIVHRDLKPANVKLTPGGRVKLLDFGLAKAYAGVAADGSSPDLSQSPTMPAQATQAGVILGTAAYMSPEQARGKPVDKRADIWAFGVVLYEMLTGKQLFAGDTVSDVLAAVLTREPDWDRLPSGLPGGVAASLRRCLERDPRRRLRDIGDFRFDGEPGSAPPPYARSRWPTLAVAGLACAALGGLAARTLSPRPHPGPGLTRSSILLPEDRPYLVDNWPSRGLAIAPDGSRLVYVAQDPTAENGRRLYERSLDALGVRPVPGTEGGHAPFFSPDGRWLAFFTTAESALRKVPLSGGPAIALTRGVTGPGWANGSWRDDGSLVFYDWPRGLRVLSEGGEERQLLASPEGEIYLHPEPLEGSDLLLYTVQTDDGYRIEAATPSGERRHTVVEGGSHGLALASGHLLFGREGVFYVAPFEATSARVTGPAVPLPMLVKVDNRDQEEPRPQLAVSRNGTLAYVPTSGALDRESALAWIDPSGGGVERLGTIAAGTPALRLSPDGGRLAIASRVGSVVRYEILQLQSMTTTLVAEVKSQLPGRPAWHPDGRHLLVTTSKLASSELWLYDVEGEDSPALLGEVPGTEVQGHSISPDGRYLIGSSVVPETGVDVWVMDLESPGADAGGLRPFVATPAEEWEPSFSPDGRFVAYVSDESGRNEVHVRRFPGGDGRVRISAEGGGLPRWSPRGDEIYYWRPRSFRLLSQRFDAERGVGVGPSRVVFEDTSFTGHGTSFDVAPDGRILVRTLAEDTNRAREIVVVQNWFQEVKRLTGGDSSP